MQFFFNYIVPSTKGNAGIRFTWLSMHSIPGCPLNMAVYGIKGKENWAGVMVVND